MTSKFEINSNFFLNTLRSKIICDIKSLVKLDLRAGKGQYLNPLITKEIQVLRKREMKFTEQMPQAHYPKRSPDP